jgi:ribonuclease-3
VVTTKKNRRAGAARAAGLQQRLHHRFANPALLQRALTHRSHSADHNERLEFLGDSVLGLGVAHMLYEALGDGAEGDLSRLRASWCARTACTSWRSS